MIYRPAAQLWCKSAYELQEWLRYVIFLNTALNILWSEALQVVRIYVVK